MKNLRTLFRPFLVGGVAVAMSVPLLGCGGAASSSSVTEGAARVTIQWPESTRLIPAASNSVKVSFLRGATVVASQTAARPDTGGSTTLAFTDLPAQTLTLRAEAFPNANGTGTAQASASKSVSIVAHTNTDLAITMASTIGSIGVSPALSNLLIGETTILEAVPVDGSGRIVLLSDAATSWSSTNESVASVSDTGAVTARAAGETTIRFTDSESGQFGTATVRVSSGQGDAEVIIK